MAHTLEDRIADVLDIVLSGERPDESDLAGLGKPLRRSIQRLHDRLGPGKVTFDLSRIEDCQKVLLDYARYDFSKSAEITPARDELDALALTINIAGEELQTADTQVGVRRKLQLSLAEKNVLLREVHHRVKNNMQVITSLLSLQANNVQDERLDEELQYTQYRIKSMAMVHEMLYGTGDLGYINYEKYLNQLITTLAVSIKGPDSNITTHIDAKSIQLNIDTAIPLGLLINELITNSLIHAFPGDGSGHISVAIKRLPEHYELKLSDNGIGFPIDFDFQNSSSLGLGLVDTLTLQLDGKLHRETNNGTTYLITFKQIESNA